MGVKQRGLTEKQLEKQREKDRQKWQLMLRMRIEFATGRKLGEARKGD